MAKGKRKASPPPDDDEPHHLVIYNPFAYSLEERRLYPKHLQGLVQWLSCIFGQDSVLAVYTKNTEEPVIVSIIRECDVQSFLGEHSWEQFLTSPRRSEKGQKSKIFVSTLLTSASITKRQWLDISEHIPSKTLPSRHEAFTYPYPKPRWTPLPEINIMSTALPLGQPIPLTEPSAPEPEPIPPSLEELIREQSNLSVTESVATIPANAPESEDTKPISEIRVKQEEGLSSKMSKFDPYEEESQALAFLRAGTMSENGTIASGNDFVPKEEEPSHELLRAQLQELESMAQLPSMFRDSVPMVKPEPVEEKIPMEPSVKRESLPVTDLHLSGSEHQSSRPVKMEHNDADIKPYIKPEPVDIQLGPGSQGGGLSIKMEPASDLPARLAHAPGSRRPSRTIGEPNDESMARRHESSFGNDPGREASLGYPIQIPQAPVKEESKEGILQTLPNNSLREKPSAPSSLGLNGSGDRTAMKRKDVYWDPSRDPRIASRSLPSQKRIKRED